MSLVSIGIPNFVTGVSQQPPALKLPTAVDEMTNCWPSIVSGLSKRPPTEFVANLGTAFTSSAIGSIINRTGVAQFIIVIADGDLKVFDLNGVQKTVNFPKGKAYLQQASDPSSAFKFVNIQDTTFILNKEVVVKANPYGELDNVSYTPDGQVYAFNNLPNPTTTALGTVYQLTSTNQYYKNTLMPAVAAKYDWSKTGTNVTPPGGANIVTTLPAVASAPGDIVYLNITTTTYVPIWTGSYWIPWPVTNTTYDQYTAVLTSGAVAAYNYWNLVTIDELVSDLNNGRRNPAHMATIFITNSVANVYYNVYINNVLKGTYLSPTGVDAGSSVPGTSKIAEFLKASLQSNGYTVEQDGSTLTITNMGINDTIKGTSSGGDKLVKCWRNTVPSFSDLPPNSPQGRILQVSGDLESNQDDYYVIYNKGRWEETYGYGAGIGLNANTVPWVLMRNANGTFTFTQHTWRDRNCGDNSTGRVPSFVDNRINDMFLYANRLCFITDTDLVMSETFRYENFFRTTLASLQDNDPIYLTIATQNDDTLRHIAQFNKELLIMADKSQYRFSYSQFVGPKNVQVAFTTSFNVSRSVAPANMGNSIYFVDDASTYRYGKVYEYYPRPNQQGDDADEVTDPVPNYIPAGITFLAGSPRMEMLVCGNKTETNALYVYKFFWAGDKKVQNCWHKWTIGDNTTRIYWAGFMDNYLYILIKRNTNVHLERIRVDEEPVADALTPRAFLDRLSVFTVGSTSVTYNAGTGKTALVLGYTPNSTSQVVGFSNTESAVALSVDSVVGNTVYLVGDYTAWTLFVGVPYTMSFTLSTPYLRKQSGNGQTAILDGRLAVRYLHLVYSKTTYFKTLLKRKGYPDQYIDRSSEFDSTLIDNVNVSLGTTPLVDGQLRVPILAHNMDFTIQMLNDSPFNCIFQSGEWWCTYHPRTRQIA